MPEQVKTFPQILIKTPITSDGTALVLDASGRVTYREDLADARSRADFERQNTKLPTNLKKIIEDYVEPKETKEDVPEEGTTEPVKAEKTVTKHKVK